MFGINQSTVSENHAPYVIAELSANHNGSLERAKLSIKAAKEAGAHAVKLQTYTAETMTIDSDKDDFLIKSGLWAGYKLFDLYKEAQTPFEWHTALFDYAKELGIDCFSTPFDESAFSLLQELGAPAYKIASFELTDLPLIKLVAGSGKPLLMSTGMATEEEISEAVSTAKDAGAEAILLFHCISGYPTPVSQSNLRKIPFLKERFGVSVGLSDHTIGATAAITAVALGAVAIEKHFTLSRAEKGPDSEFSIEPEELKDLVNLTRDAWSALGDGSEKRADVEAGSRSFRRSLYFVRAVAPGQIIQPDDIRRIRPGYGLPPKYFDDVVGRRALVGVEPGDRVTQENVEIK